MKYYNTSLGNCAAPSSGVYQVSNTLIRKPPSHPSPVAGVAGELRDFFPSPRHPLASLRLRMRGLPPSTVAKISSCDEEKNYRDVCKGKSAEMESGEEFVKYIFRVTYRVKLSSRDRAAKSILGAAMISITVPCLYCLLLRSSCLGFFFVSR